MLKRIPPYLKNFYVVGTLSFVVWITFIDNNDLITRFRMGAKLRQLEHEREYYQEKIKEVEKDRSELLSDKELLEKFAREKYLMKKPSEDIFIIEEQD